MDQRPVGMSGLNPIAADYNMTYEPGDEVAEQRLQEAQEFVETIKDHLHERGFLDE